MEINNRVFTGRVIIIEVHMWLSRRTQLVVRNRLLDAFLNRTVQRVLKQRILMHFLDQIGWNLTSAETGHTHLRRDFLYLGIDA